MRQPQDNSNLESVDWAVAGANLSRFMASMLAASVAVFWRYNFGRNALGASAALVLVAVPLYGGCFDYRQFDQCPLLWYMVAYLFALFCQRVDGWMFRRKRPRVHSYYNGTPRMQAWFPSWDEIAVKRYVEAPLTALIGILVTLVNVPLGTWIVLGGIGIQIELGDWEAQQRRESERMHDAYLESQLLAERFRSLRGDDA